MTTNEKLKEYINRPLSLTTGALINILRDFLDENTAIPLRTELEAIESNYDLMLQYMRQGIVDPQRSRLVIDFKQKLKSLMSDALVWYDRLNTFGFRNAWINNQNTLSQISIDGIMNHLQEHVTTLAMSGLTDNAKEAKRQESGRHHAFMENLFGWLLCSTHWTRSDADTVNAILQSPTCAVNDQLTIVSGMMLNTLQYFDINKLRVFADVYCSYSCDNKVRQYALIALVLCLNEEADSKKEQISIIEELFLRMPEAIDEMTSLQYQIFTTLEAEKDGTILQKDIIPEMIKNNPDIKITSRGIEQKEHDPLRDILDPHAAEREQQEMEKIMDRLAGMAGQGADLYFSAFSQLKRHSFFQSSLFNWFCPFTLDHPALNNIPDDVKNLNMVKLMLQKGPFCDSDKYSLVLTMGQILSTIPQEMRKMMEENNVNSIATTASDANDAFTIRQRILQGLYRFYKLSPYKDHFTNILYYRGKEIKSIGPQRVFFFANKILSQTPLNDKYIDMLRYMIKKGRRYHAGVQRLMEVYPANKVDIEFHKLQAYYYIKQNSEMANLAACMSLTISNTMEPGDVWTMKNLAKVNFRMRKYDEACSIYKELREIVPEDRGIMLNYAICQMYNGQAEEASQLLFQLYYENEDSIKVRRALAWCQLLNDRPEDSLHTYQAIIGFDDSLCSPSQIDGELDDEDLLGAGFAAWILNKMPIAIAMLSKYVEKNSVTALMKEILRAEPLKKKGIKTIDAQLMLDLIS